MKLNCQYNTIGKITYINNYMFYLACTRFNDETYEENMTYREKHKEAVIYGITLQIRNSYPAGCLIFVVEMNNNTNKIEGIGLIKNSLVHNKHCKIYKENEYNRYIYGGKYWLSREYIMEYDNNIVKVFDTILFKGKTHVKRQIGISILNEKLFTRWEYDFTVIKYTIKKMFLNAFTNNTNTNINTNNT